MILLFIKSYLTILLSVGFGSSLLFIVGLYWIVRQQYSTPPCLTANFSEDQKHLVNENEEDPPTIASADISAIAGEDSLITQLDLARAYIETGRMQLAKNILDVVLKQGNYILQKEAESLLQLLDLSALKQGNSLPLKKLPD